MSEVAASEASPPRDWFESASLLVRSPRRFFAAMPAPADLAAPRNFIFIMVAAANLEALVYNADKVADAGVEFVLLAIAAGAAAIPVVGFAVGVGYGAVIHLVARLLGGRQPFAASFAIACYASITAPLMLLVLWVPALGPAFGCAHLFLCTLGLIEAQRVRPWKALLVMAIIVAALAANRIRIGRRLEQAREARERDVARRAHPGDI